MQIAEFELTVQALDVPTEKRRWNGDPMASNEASTALWRAVDAFNEQLTNAGLTVVHSSYGVTATEVDIEVQDE